MTDTDPTLQTKILDLLSDPALHGGAAVARIETHANRLAVGPQHAFKIKRAVQYPFLDYSTLALRETYCREEVRLNRRTAPDLYLGVRKVVAGPDGGLALVAEDAPGDAVEWVVAMRSFDQSTLFDRLAGTGALTPDLLDELAAAIARFHGAAAVTEVGWASAIRAVAEENIDELAAAGLWDAARVDEMRTRCLSALDAAADRLSDRAAGGHVRECHGDLHLRNICLIGGEPTLFDCIEFNPDFARIDCLYDLAFLIMDLRHRSLAPEASGVWNRYLEVSGDYDGAGLLPLYVGIRAQVRAKIEAATMRFVDPEAADRHRREADRYFALAEASFRDRNTVLVAVGGPSGSGKSTVARGLAPRLGGFPVILRSDAIRKELHGADQTAPLPSEAYAPAVSARVYRTMEERAARVLRQGVTALADATFTLPLSRTRIEAAAVDAGVAFAGLWLDAPPEVLKQRVSERTGDVSDATASVVAKQLAEDWGDIQWPRFMAAEKETPGDFLDRICAAASGELPLSSG